MLRALIAALLIAVAAAPAASAAVVTQDFGAAAHGAPIVGSDAHLPPLSAATPYDAGPVVGDEIIAFRQSGGYQADIRGVDARARSFVDSWIDAHCGPHANAARVRGCRAMLVSDIDDTLISWYAHYASPAIDFQYVPTAESIAKAGCTPPAIHQTVALLHYAQSRGVTIALMSGRTTAERTATIRCLDLIDVTGYRYLILRTPSEAHIPALDYKSNRRRLLERAGWRIMLSIGDQPSDLLGGYTDSGFLLPNPMYLIP